MERSWYGIYCTLLYITRHLRNGKREARYCTHTSTVHSFIPFPMENGSKSRKKVITLSKDNSLSVIDLEDLRCKCRLLGHETQVIAIHWRYQDELLAIECTGGLYIWQYKMKHLERFVEVERAEDIIGAFSASVRVCDYDLNFLNASTKSTMHLIPIQSNHESRYQCVPSYI